MLWTDALIADTYHLSAAEFGAYVRLLMVAWRRPGCNLPDDDGYLAKSAGASPRHWVTLRPVVMAFWDKGEDGLFRQKRLTGEHTYATAKRVQRSQAGTASALKRKKTASTDVAPSLVRSYQQPTLPIKKEGSSLGSSEPKDPPSRDLLGSEEPPSKYAFEGKVVRLTHKDFSTWQVAYPHLRDLNAMLQSRDDFLSGVDPKDRKNWFMSTSAWLNNRNQEAAKSGDPMGDGYI